MKRATRLLALLGVVGVGWLLLGARPREVLLVYDVAAAPEATAVEVDLRREGALVRHARLQLHRGEQVRHPVQLQDGTYELAWRLERPAGAVTGVRTLAVDGDQTIVLALGQ